MKANKFSRSTFLEQTYYKRVYTVICIIVRAKSDLKLEEDTILHIIFNILAPFSHIK